jgi:site-specific DNA-methyltransferase (adenine-specific)
MKPTHKHSKGVGEIPLLSFIVRDRIREDDEAGRKYIEEELVPSIAEQGLIHPIVLNELAHEDKGLNLAGDVIESKFELVAGWNRAQAFLMLNHKTVPYNLRSGLDRATLHAIEQEENLRRRDMDWVDKILGIYRVHTLRSEMAAKKFESWSQRATGELLRTNRATITQSLEMAKYLLANDEAILNCTSFEAARQVLLGREQKRAEAELMRREPLLTQTLATNPKDVATICAPKAEPDFLGLHPIPTREIALVESHEIPLSQWFFNEPCVLPLSDWKSSKVALKEAKAQTDGWMPKQPAESVDIVFTDIPFGIDMDNLDLVTMDEVEAEHDVDENVAQMLPFLYQSYRLLRDKRYLVFFYDIKHQEKLADWGQTVGFNVQPYPIIWHKLHTVKNRAASKWWPKKIEYIMIMAKGTATLREAQLDCVIAASNEAERKRFGHPFSKPFDVCRKVLEPIAKPGDIVLDPYMGRGSMLSACLSLGLSPRGCEKKLDHFNGAMNNLKESYTRILGTRQPVFT